MTSIITCQSQDVSYSWSSQEIKDQVKKCQIEKIKTRNLKE